MRTEAVKTGDEGMLGRQWSGVRMALQIGAQQSMCPAGACLDT